MNWADRLVYGFHKSTLLLVPLWGIFTGLRGGVWLGMQNMAMAFVGWMIAGVTVSELVIRWERFHARATPR